MGNKITITSKKMITNMNFNWIKKAVALSVAIVALAGCEKNEGSAKVASRGMGPRTALANTFSVNGMNLVGTITHDPQNQAGFQEAVYGFLSTDVHQEYIGFVSVTGQQYNSGVRFGGRVAPVSGSLRNLGGGEVAIAQNSRLAIQVADYNPQSPNTPLIPAFQFTNASGYISGNQVEIQFTDSYGTIVMYGILNSQTNEFLGDIHYDNNVHIIPGQTPAAGNLGRFRIPICAFFVCN